METIDKIKNLNEEYNKYSHAVVKLLNDSLKEGEIFLFKKLGDGSFGLILSEERNNLIKTSEPTQCELLLSSINNVLINNKITGYATQSTL
jgi:hypothetical protein